MAEHYDKMFTIAYCTDQSSGAWGDPKEFESMEKVQQGCEVLQDSHYSKDTGGLHPVMMWNEGMSVEGGGSKAPGQLSAPKPGLTVVTLNANMVRIGKLYEAFSGCTDKGNLVNWKLFFFRSKFPEEQKQKERNHHFFTITGIASRIAGMHQDYSRGEGSLQLILQPNRISWFDHDTKTGGKLGWDAPTGQKVGEMPESPI